MSAACCGRRPHLRTYSNAHTGIFTEVEKNLSVRSPATADVWLRPTLLLHDAESSTYVKFDNLSATRLGEGYGEVAARSGECDVRDADLFGGLVIGAC